MLSGALTWRELLSRQLAGVGAAEAPASAGPRPAITPAIVIMAVATAAVVNAAPGAFAIIIRPIHAIAAVTGGTVRQITTTAAVATSRCQMAISLAAVGTRPSATGPTGCLIAAQIDQARGVIHEWLQRTHFTWEGAGRCFRVRLCLIRIFEMTGPGVVESCEPLRNQCINKYPDMISGFFGYAFSVAEDLLMEIIYAVLPVNELPEVDAGRTQPKTMTPVGVEENGPVVKFLPEHDVRVGYGFVSVLHRSRHVPL